MLRDKLTTDVGSSTERTPSSFLFIQFCQFNNGFIQTKKLIWIWMVEKIVFLFQAKNKKSEGFGRVSSNIRRTELPEIIIWPFLGEISLKEISFKWISFLKCIHHIPIFWGGFFLADQIVFRKLIFSTVTWISLSI